MAKPQAEEGQEETIREEAARGNGELLHFPSPAGGERADEAQRHSRAYLLGEFAFLFIALPLIFFFHLAGPLPLLPTLWAAAAGALVLLLRDRSFDRRELWNPGRLRRELPQILALFAAGSFIITTMMWRYAPSSVLGMVRHDPRMWAFIMLSYPIVSVYPQSLVYRAFFFHRYRRVFGRGASRRSWPMVVASAATFSLAHIIFHNWVAVALTFAGGLLFAARYVKTRSLCVSFVEHTLYGWLMFTVGLGHFFITKTM